MVTCETCQAACGQEHKVIVRLCRNGGTPKRGHYVLRGGAVATEAPTRELQVVAPSVLRTQAHGHGRARAHTHALQAATLPCTGARLSSWPGPPRLPAAGAAVAQHTRDL